MAVVLMNSEAVATCPRSNQPSLPVKMERGSWASSLAEELLAPDSHFGGWCVTIGGLFMLGWMALTPILRPAAPIRLNRL